MATRVCPGTFTFKSEVLGLVSLTTRQGKTKSLGRDAHVSERKTDTVKHTPLSSALRILLELLLLKR